MGNAEVCAGLCSILKAIAVLRTEYIPANLHCDNIDQTLPGIRNGTLEVS